MPSPRVRGQGGDVTTNKRARRGPLAGLLGLVVVALVVGSALPAFGGGGPNTPTDAGLRTDSGPSFVGSGGVFGGASTTIQTSVFPTVIGGLIVVSISFVASTSITSIPVIQVSDTGSGADSYVVGVPNQNEANEAVWADYAYATSGQTQGVSVFINTSVSTSLYGWAANAAAYSDVGLNVTVGPWEDGCGITTQTTAVQAGLDATLIGVTGYWTTPAAISYTAGFVEVPTFFAPSAYADEAYYLGGATAGVNLLTASNAYAECMNGILLSVSVATNHPIVVEPFLTAIAENSTTVLSAWTAPQNVSVVDYIVIWRATCAGANLANSGPLTNPALLTYLASGLTPSASYCFVVGYYNGAAWDYYASNFVPVVTLDPFVSAPILTGAAYVNGCGWAVACGSLVALNWTAPSNISVVNYTLYEAPWPCAVVYYQMGGCLGGLVVSLGSSVNGGTTTAVMPYNTTWEFVIGTWTSAHVRGPPSNWLVVTSPFDSQRPSVLSIAAVSFSSVALAWAAAVNVSVVNYTVEYGTTFGVYPSHVSEGTALDAVVSGLASNTTYYFVVVPWVSASVAAPSSNVAPAHTTALAPLLPPPPAGYVFPWGIEVTVTVFISIAASAIAYYLARRKVEEERG